MFDLIVYNINVIGWYRGGDEYKKYGELIKILRKVGYFHLL